MLCQLIALHSHYHRQAEHTQELQAQFDHWKEERVFFYWKVFISLLQHRGICTIKYLLMHKLEENGGSAIKSYLLVHKSNINSPSVILLNFLCRE